MVNLVLADLVRLVRRRELLVVAAAVLVFLFVAFFEAFLVAKSNVDIATAVPPPERDIEQFLEDQARYREAALVEFSSPAAVRLILAPGFPILPVAAVLSAVLSMGSDFEWGTVRGAVLLAGSRNRYLVARGAALSILLGVLVGAAALVGVLAPPLIGTVFREPLGVSLAGLPSAVDATVGALAAAVVYAGIGLAATTVARSMGLGLVFSAAVLSADALLTMLIRPTTETLASVTVAGSAGALVQSGRDIEVVTFLAAGAWLLLAILIAVRAFNSHDLVE